MRVSKNAPIGACVFDAYGTLFDTQAAAASLAASLGPRAAELGERWRAKQLQYTWLRSLTGRHADFARVTEDALGYALQSLGLDDARLAPRLLGLYRQLPAYAEVPQALARLRARGLPLAILSNGTPRMLADLVQGAGLAACFDALLSVEEVGIFKPHPSVYGLAAARLGVAAERILFVSANGWDAWSAKAYGFRVLWCNRAGLPPERLPDPPDAEIAQLGQIEDWLDNRAG